MDVKPGYKLTDVGVIPEDWNLTPLGRLVISVEYGSAAKSNANGRIPVLRMGNLQAGKLDWSDLVYTDDESEITKYSLRHGDVLFNRTNTIDLVGKTSIYLGEQPAIFAGYLIRINVFPDRLDSRFLNYVLNTEFARKHSAKVLSVAVGQANINGQKLKKYPIPLPPTKVEQEAIAGALSDADGFIESLEELVAKKRRIKLGAMQVLLTGQKRLPGFTDEWEVKRLGELGESLIGLTYKPSDVRSAGVLVLRSSNVFEGGLRFEDNVFVKMDIPVRIMVQSGDILICVRNGSRDLIGKCAKIDNRATGMTFGAFMTVFRSPLHDFIYHQFQSDVIKRQIHEHLGATINQITNRSLNSFQIPIPPNDREQSAIAAILSDMDTEITMLEAKLAKARQVKQGMMQELLTGRIRLIEPAKASTAPTGHNWAFNEAVVISVLAKGFGSEQFPLGRKRYTKLSYLMHRHHEHQAEGYLKKAAGPYNPDTKYKGPEAIAIKNGYVRPHARDKFSGFVASDKIAEADTYFRKWYGDDVLIWLEQFRFKPNDELELLATVDMAMEDLRQSGKSVELSTVKSVIRNHPEWEAKLERDIFSDTNIARAIKQCGELFANCG